MNAILPFPGEDMVAAAAVAVLKVMRANPHIYQHTLRYLNDTGQREFAQRAARAALYSAWCLPDHGPDDGLGLKMARIARLLEALDTE